MKITKKQLMEIIEEEITMIEQDGGEEMLSAMEDIPKTARNLVDKINREVEALANTFEDDQKPAIITSLKSAIAAILTAE
tara:strand:+ start:77 stop:316 length:240 start_codon:yes stop_codon:yes gene_type:complete